MSAQRATCQDFSQSVSCSPSGAASLARACQGLCGSELPIDISEAFVADILKPYRTNAKYLKSAQITHFMDKGSVLTGTGRFAIPESCYIDDTGHFNAVEFNICFNQLAYVLFGKCIEEGMLQRLILEKVDVLSPPEFKRQQLPSMVIVSIASRYYKQL